MTNAVARKLMNFTPKEYYEGVMDFYGVDTDKHPWMIKAFDPSVRKQVMFAVFDFHCPGIDGRSVAAMIVTYKSLHSEWIYERIVYLDNMCPACQVPPPYQYRIKAE